MVLDMDNNWRPGRKWENIFLLEDWWVQQGVALGARFPTVSVKDRTVG